MYRIIFLFALSSLFSTQIQIGNEVLTVEIADTPSTIAKGLMGRKELPEGTGMLFIFPNAKKLHFWMKNTSLPLSIGFFDADRILINVAEMEPLTGTAFSTKPALYALEVPQGWFAKHKIAPGAKFSGDLK